MEGCGRVEAHEPLRQDSHILLLKCVQGSQEAQTRIEQLERLVKDVVADSVGNGRSFDSPTHRLPRQLAKKQAKQLDQQGLLSCLWNKESLCESGEI